MSKELFYTESLNLAAYLVSKNQEIIEVTDHNKFIRFKFSRCDELHSLIKEYNSNKELKNFISSYRVIRNIISEMKQKGGE